MPQLGRSEISMLEKRVVTLALLAYLALALTLALSSPGTYDAGDSIVHFQIARWAFIHPENFLSHWGKPIFTLLASPFAQFGFAGMKVMQCLLATAIGWLAWRSAHKLRLPMAWLAPIFTLAAPEFFLAQLSGLTEPLFAFTLLLGTFLFLHERPYWAAIALSFLPHVRTEGALLVPIFVVFALLRGHWRSIPLFAVGTLLYMLVGGILKGNFLWVWTEIPYLSDQAYYGRGELLHFPISYVYVVGVPLYGLTALGLFLPGLAWFRRRQTLDWEAILLVYAPWLVFFAAHVYFWSFGVGHSMGMLRVMICIVPLGALIALKGIATVLDFLPAKPAWRLGLALPILAYVLIFPLTSNPAAIHAKDLELSVDQQMVRDAMTFIRAQGMGDRLIFSAHPGTPFFQEKDPFDPTQTGELLQLGHQDPPAGTLILLDSWFGRVEAGYVEADFDGRPDAYRRLGRWTGAEGGTPIVITLYERI
jgi:hypothetical protein